MMKAAPRGLVLLARGSSWILLVAITLALSFAFAACGSSDNGAKADGDASPFVVDPDAFELFWLPPDQTLALDGSGPQSATYKLMATSHGMTREVTPEAVSFD